MESQVLLACVWVHVLVSGAPAAKEEDARYPRLPPDFVTRMQAAVAEAGERGGLPVITTAPPSHRCARSHHRRTAAVRHEPVQARS